VQQHGIQITIPKICDARLNRTSTLCPTNNAICQSSACEKYLLAKAIWRVGVVIRQPQGKSSTPKSDPSSIIRPKQI
jgi:hypothetical protein